MKFILGLLIGGGLVFGWYCIMAPQTQNLGRLPLKPPSLPRKKRKSGRITKLNSKPQKIGLKA